ncbi:hypothetical protein ACA910_012494 [Epithemia clementina (nom. ined.)]
MIIGYQALQLFLAGLLSMPFSAGARKPMPAYSVEPVNVEILTESLCPGCRQFIQTILARAFDQLAPTVMNLTMIPYGNAEITDAPKHLVACQHGLRECDGNVWELCAIHKYPDPEQYFPYLKCLAQKVPDGPFNQTISPNVFKKCAVESHLWWPAIEACHKKQAWEMLAAADKATPDHNYVPWIIVDGKHIEAEDDFVAAVCEVYQEKGGSYPACAQHVKDETSMEPFPTCPRFTLISAIEE